MGIVIVLTIVVLRGLLGVIMGLLGWAVIKTSERSREKVTPFECGFDPKGRRRFPFSLHFFLVSLIFLVFDVEITLLLPSPILQGMEGVYRRAYLLVGFIFILLGGLYFEWKEGALEWTLWKGIKILY